jgi:hypothetical protein
MSAECSTRDSHLQSSLAQRYVSEIIQKPLELTVTVTCDTALDFLKQNFVMSAECSRLDSLRPFIFCTEICGRGNTDISAINSYVKYDPELDFLKQN